MRVALVVPAYAPALRYGGPVTKLRLLASALQNLGVEVQIWTAAYDANGKQMGANTVRVDGVTVKYGRLWASYRWTPVAFPIRPADLTSVDVVHVFGYRDPLTLSAVMWSRNSCVPVLVEPMGMLVPAVRKVRLKASLDRFILPSLRGIAGAIATSFLEARQLSVALPSTRLWVRFNPLGPLPPPKELIRRRQGVPRAVAVGRLSAKKRFDVAISAAASAGIGLDIVGPDDQDGTSQQLRALIDRLGVSDRVQLIGPIWGQRLFEFIREHDVFVAPSATENFGQATAEAAAMGLPVVVSPEVGVADLVLRHGCGLVASDEGSMRAALERVLDGDLSGSHDALALREILDASTVAREQLSLYGLATRRDPLASEQEN